ncbi:MAG: PQQ-dependent sugar dehydrogenase, partial [Gemmatimonadaceae bacterium]
MKNSPSLRARALPPAASTLARGALASVVVVLGMASCRAASRSAPAVATAAPATTAAAPANAPTLPAPDPSRFQQDVLLNGVFNEPVELAVARDGRVFIIERPGVVSVYDPRARQQRRIAQIAVSSEYENGLIGLALDPGFDTNHWLYLNYSKPTGDAHRLSRFTLDGDSLRDEKALLEVKYDKGCCHTGGSIAFDAQGHLFVSYGDNSNPFTAGDYAPIDPTPGKSLADALRSSGNTNDLRGKILRITPTPDGKYTIPVGNLFASAAEGRPEIYTMGHRNPYRISVDKHTGFLYWGEIGPDAQRDSVYGPRGYDEVNQARRAGNFGWPMFIADNKPYRHYNFTTGQLFEFFDPAHPVNSSPNNTGAKVLPPAQPALIYYPYEKSTTFPLLGEGSRSAMAGPVYHFGDYAGSEVRLPEYYDKKFIHYDWMRGWMMATTISPAGDFVRMEPFLTPLTLDHPSDVELGPDGSLYVLEYGTYWNAANKNARLSRITYHPGNRPPVARVTVSRTVGVAPLTTLLSARGSFDDSDSLVATWIIPGRVDVVNQSVVTHTFNKPGTYDVRLLLRDREGAETEKLVQIRAGNDPPNVTLDVAGNRSFYFGQPSVDYDVKVTDAEDGQLRRGIDARRVNVSLKYDPPASAPSAASASGQQPVAASDGLARMRKSDCLACHGVEQASQGPAYVRVAERYAGRADAMRHLMTKIVTGGSGVWGERVMPPHPSLTTEDTRAIVTYILSLASKAPTLPTRGKAALDKHAAAPGGVYRLTATYADQPRNGIGPLADTAEVVLRPPRVHASAAVDVKGVGVHRGTGPDGAAGMLATAYAGNAHLFMGRLDLSGIAQVTFEFRSGDNR